jgi:hypothetical protein
MSARSQQFTRGGYFFPNRLAFCHALIVDAIHEISARE